eukprot:scaffold100145_cov35-Prasinocladus_malaysianus.AAC.2
MRTSPTFSLLRLAAAQEVQPRGRVWAGPHGRPLAGGTGPGAGPEPLKAAREHCFRRGARP